MGWKSVLKHFSVQSDLRLKWEKKEFIGSGSFGDVYKCPIKGIKAQFIAVKVPKIRYGLSDFDKLNEETSLLSTLSHENIIRFYGICEIQQEAYYTLGIAMAWANLGGLDNCYTTLSEFQRATVSSDIIHGLMYLHSKNVVHRDMKLANVLIDGDLNQSVIAKIGDFGLARKIEDYMSVAKGSYKYMAPEMAIQKSKYDERVDIYSLSILLYELYSRAPFPFQLESESLPDILDAVKKSVKPKQMPINFPSTISNLIMQGWNKEPSERPDLKVFDKTFLNIMKNNLEQCFHQEIPTSTNLSIEEHLKLVEDGIFLPSPIFSCEWSSTLEEGDSKNLRKQMVENIKAHSNRAKNILLPIYTALEIVPKHVFMNEEKTFGATRNDKIATAYHWDSSMDVARATSIRRPWAIGLQLSMMKIDVGHDVLLLGARGYIEALVSQLVGPMGSVSVVSRDISGINICKHQVEHSAPNKNIQYHLVESYNALEQLSRTKKFDAILAPTSRSFPEYLTPLLKDDGTLLADIFPGDLRGDYIEVYIAGNARMKKPTERRKIQGYSVQRSSKRYYNTNFKNLNFKKPSDEMYAPLPSSPASMPTIWSDEVEEDNSRQLRQQMVQSIRNNDHKESICQEVYHAMETVPRHYFMFDKRTPGENRTEKIKRSYDSSLSMAVATREYECPASHLALRLSIMKINTGSKVLLFGAFGYTEALVSHLVGPFGNVTVVTRNAIDIQISRRLVEKSPIKNITYLLVDEWTKGIKQKECLKPKTFNAILAPLLPNFPESLTFLLKEGGILLAGIIPPDCEEGYFETYVAPNVHGDDLLPKRRKLTDFSITRIGDYHI